MSWRRRAQAVRDLLDCIVVQRGVEPLGERALIFRRGRGPSFAGAAIDLASVEERSATPWAAFRRWPERRIASELAPFLEGRTVWPPYREFFVAGLSRAHAQVWAWGGPHYWAHKFELAVPEGFVSWTDRRVEDGLRPLLAGRTSWPRKRDFFEAGLGELHKAISHHGGHVHWAEEFGVVPWHNRDKRVEKDELETAFLETFGRRESFPRKEEFEGLGKRRLFERMRCCGGRDYWARRLGVRVASGWADSAGVGVERSG